jgi:hypothetical protein
VNTECEREIVGQTEELESVSGEGVEVEAERADDGEVVEQSSVAVAAAAAAAAAAAVETIGLDEPGRVTL